MAVQRGGFVAQKGAQSVKEEGVRMSAAEQELTEVTEKGRKGWFSQRRRARREEFPGCVGAAGRHSPRLAEVPGRGSAEAA